VHVDQIESEQKVAFESGSRLTGDFMWRIWHMAGKFCW